MTTDGPRFAWAGSLLVLVALWSTPVLANDHTALLPFTGGKNASATRQRIQTKLRAANVSLVPLKQTTSAWRASKNRAKVASKLDAKFLVSGRVRKSGEQWVADIQVFNAGGKRVRKFRIASTKLVRVGNRAAQKLLDTKLLPKVRGAAPAAPPPSVMRIGPEKEGATPPPPPPKPRAPKSATPRIVVGSFEGRSAAKIRTGAVRAFSGKPVKLVANKTLVTKARAMGANLKKNNGHVAPARALGVDAIVGGDVELEGNTWTAYVRLIDGRSAQVLRQEYYEARTAASLARVIEKDLWGGFKGEIAELHEDRDRAIAKAAKGDTSKQAARDRRRDERKTARYKGKRLPTALDLAFYFRFIRRTFTYNDVLSPDLRDYSIRGAPGIALRFRWYPGAHFVSNVASQFGVDIEYERLFNFESTRADDGQTFPGRSRAWGVGLRWRYPFKRVQPSLMVAYGRHSFEVLPSGPPRPGLDNTPEIPQVNYEFIRYGGEVRWDVVAGLKLTINGSFLQVLETGGISSNLWFPDAKANGMTAEFLLGYAIPANFEVRAGFDYRRYFFDLNPRPPNPPFVAGGALDVYWGLTLGIAWRY